MHIASQRDAYPSTLNVHAASFVYLGFRQTTQGAAAARDAEARASAARRAARAYAAARAIQDAWRGWRHKRAFKAYRDLLNFRYAVLSTRALALHTTAPQAARQLSHTLVAAEHARRAP